jgi:AraC family transcriptional regulator
VGSAKARSSRDRKSPSTPPGPDLNRAEYDKRVNRVIDHIREHLDEELSLPRLARIAAFSPFHFHRLFKAITGETLFGFVQRVRIERAAGVLKSRTDRSVLEVALDYGFSSAATFARAFRAHFGMSATEWRAGGADRWRARQPVERKIGKPLRNPGKAARLQPPDTRRGRLMGRAGKAPSVPIVKELPGQHVAYMRYVGPYGVHGIPELWIRLRKWMDTRGLDLATTTRLGLVHDDPSITQAEKCRYDACVVVPEDFAADRWVNVVDIAGGRYGVWTFSGTAHEIQEAWDRIFTAWLPTSGYQPDDRACFEVYRGSPGGKPGSFRCELCLPVKPL